MGRVGLFEVKIEPPKSMLSTSLPQFTAPASTRAEPCAVVLVWCDGFLVVHVFCFLWSGFRAEF